MRGAKPRTIEERLQRRTCIHPSGCWIWTGHNKRGYGIITINSSCLQTHRVSYAIRKGPIPEGYEIDHLCYNPTCLNPDHLEAVTHEENIRRRRDIRWQVAYRDLYVEAFGEISVMDLVADARRRDLHNR